MLIGFFLLASLLFSPIIYITIVGMLIYVMVYVLIASCQTKEKERREREKFYQVFFTPIELQFLLEYLEMSAAKRKHLINMSFDETESFISDDSFLTEINDNFSEDGIEDERSDEEYTWTLHFLQGYLKLLYSPYGIQKCGMMRYDDQFPIKKEDYIYEVKRHYEFIRKFCINNSFRLEKDAKKDEKP